MFIYNESLSFSITIEVPLVTGHQFPFQCPNLCPHPGGETAPHCPIMHGYYRPAVNH